MQPTLIEFYRSIEDASERMLASARAGCWDDVARSETTCSVLIAQLKMRAEVESLDAEARREKTLIMQRILRNDALIRKLADPCVEEIDSLINRGASQVH